MSDTPSITSDAAKYGWPAIPRDPTRTFTDTTTKNLHAPTPHSPSTLPYPSTPLVEKSLAHISSHLPRETLNHSLRVYYYGVAMLTDQFPGWMESGRLDPETWMLTCLWHDFGTTEGSLRGTRMSFDFWVGRLVLAFSSYPMSSSLLALRLYVLRLMLAMSLPFRAAYKPCNTSPHRPLAPPPSLKQNRSQKR